MRCAYITKRKGPEGYVAVTKLYAELLHLQGIAVTICGNNVNSYHVFHGWYLGMTLKQGDDFHKQVNRYVYNSSTELLRYPVFYVKKECIQERKG